MRIDITHHHDGHGLNDQTVIEADDRDPKAGNASHSYLIRREDIEDANPGPSPLNGNLCAVIHFQHGARDVEGSTPGILDGALLAVLIDRYEGFQAGPFACSENDKVLDMLHRTLGYMKARADARAAQKVLGKNEAHVS